MSKTSLRVLVEIFTPQSCDQEKAISLQELHLGRCNSNRLVFIKWQYNYILASKKVLCMCKCKVVVAQQLNDYAASQKVEILLPPSSHCWSSLLSAQLLSQFGSKHQPNKATVHSYIVEKRTMYLHYFTIMHNHNWSFDQVLTIYCA